MKFEKSKNMKMKRKENKKIVKQTMKKKEIIIFQKCPIGIEELNNKQFLPWHMVEKNGKRKGKRFH